MGRVKDEASRATVIGDVVGSRQAADRARLHHRITAALRDVAATALDPPAFTVGDEFQGSYHTVGDAIDAALRVRLATAPGVELRVGVCWGGGTRRHEHGRTPDR